MYKYFLGLFILLVLVSNVVGQNNYIDHNITLAKKHVDSLNTISEKIIKLNPHNGIEHILKSYKLSKKINYVEGELNALVNLGRSYYDLGDYEKSISYLYDGLELAEKCSDFKHLGKIHNDIGMCHRSLGNFTEALMHHDKALEIFKNNDMPTGIARSLNNIGICKFSLGDQNSLKYFNKSLDLYKKESDIEGTATSLNNLAIYYSTNGNYQEAKKHFRYAIKIFKQLENHLALQMCYSNLGKLNILEKRFKLAELYLDSSMSMNQSIGSKENLFNNYIIYQQLYEETNDYKKALFYSKELSKLKDTIYQDKKTEQINRLNTIYNLEKKEKELDFLQIELNLKKKQTYLLIVVIAGLLLLGVLIFALTRYRLKIAQNKQLLLKQEKELSRLKIINQEKELQKLSLDNKKTKAKFEKEIDHFNRELTTTAMKIMQNNEMLLDLKRSLLETDPKNLSFHKKISPSIKKINQIIDNDNSWEQFVIHFNDVHPNFFKHLKSNFPSITGKELKHCAFIKINLSIKEVALMMNVTTGAVEKARSRIKTKFDLEKNQSLENYILNM